MALLLVACTGPLPQGTAHPEPRYVQVALPGVPEPLQVADLTGSVVGAELDGRTPPAGGFDETFLAGIDGRPNAILLGWPGGCERRADVGIDPPAELGARPTFVLKLLTRVEPCAVRLARRLVVVFSGPVDPARFNLDVVQ